MRLVDTDATDKKLFYKQCMGKDSLISVESAYEMLMALPEVKAVPIETLDKIRSEIEQERVGYPPSADYYKAIMKCLQIIDKYKESEDKE